ncbi:hypothetical protein F0P96_20490 [Hymenobacter busanensis]|uniref:Uncharacterized protein n=1 Tax=Hymenobacter busanensis TaxID=2607656 RepID=A0AA88FEN3_9BACT|nr:hypothetical protein [Hymenobacter busanensis]KAA9325078.1 hypothetical protein F0P96_20490 [Hymenobacter busanensis]
MPLYLPFPVRLARRQHQRVLRGTKAQPITYTVPDQFFGEPGRRSRAYAEYFGNFFSFSPTTPGAYRAERAGHEDEYLYTYGQLVTIIKKSPL